MSGRRIVLVGQGRWVRSLSKGLADAGLEVTGAPLDTIRDALSASAWSQVASADLVVRVGFRPGAKTIRGVAFDIALRLFRGGARICCYWIGSDVQRAVEDALGNERVGAWRAPAHSVDWHLAGSEPLAAELATIGIGARVASFPWRTVSPPAVMPPLPNTFTVLTYLPDSRFDFYGGDAVMEVARRLPAARFLVMGGAGSVRPDAPSNVEWLGWVDDPSSLYARSSCVVRLTEHDSIGGTAVEGLLFGRPVIYTGELRYATAVTRSAQQLQAAVEALIASHEQGLLKPDEEAACWAREEFDPERRFSAMASTLETLANPKTPRQRRLTYLTLQSTSEGQAAHAHVNEIVKGLARLGWSIRLVQPRYRRRDPGVLARLSGIAGAQLAAMAAALRSDVLYVRSHFLALPTTLWAGLWRKPLVVEINGPHVDAIRAWPALKPAYRLIERSDRVQLRRASKVITVTSRLVDWIEKDAGVANAALISNGADTDRFSPDAARLDGLPSRYAVFFGALAPWQGVPVAIEAARHPQWPADVALVIAGDGMLADDVRAAADGQRIVYLGQVPYHAVPGLVAGALASLVPKLPEDHAESGLAPLKLFESMACGVPVVASDIPGMRDILSLSSAGLVVPPADPAALAAAVAELRRDPQAAAAMGASGRAAVVAEHSWARRSEDTDALLRGVLGEVSDA